jgi:hypothetical protein
MPVSIVPSSPCSPPLGTWRESVYNSVDPAARAPRFIECGLSVPTILISYRREDTAAYAGRLADRLKAHFGRDKVFVDVDTIQPGEDFLEVIDQSLRSSSVSSR